SALCSHLDPEQKLQWLRLHVFVIVRLTQILESDVEDDVRHLDGLDLAMAKRKQVYFFKHVNEAAAFSGGTATVWTLKVRIQRIAHAANNRSVCKTANFHAQVRSRGAHLGWREVLARLEGEPDLTVSSRPQREARRAVPP